MNKEAVPFSHWLDPDWSAICYNINSSPYWQAPLATTLTCIFSDGNIHVAMDGIAINCVARRLVFMLLFFT